MYPTQEILRRLAALEAQTSGDPAAPPAGPYATVTFAADASQALNDAQSRATTLTINNGVTSAARNLTSLLTPAQAKGRIFFVVNNNAHDVGYFFSSGTGTTVASNTGAIFTSDGTNLVPIVNTTI